MKVQFEVLQKKVFNGQWAVRELKPSLQKAEANLGRVRAVKVTKDVKDCRTPPNP